MAMETNSIIAFESHGKDLITLSDNEGKKIASKNAVELLAWLAKSEGKTKVVFDATAFMQPIISLLPREVVSKLFDGKATYYDNFRLWFGKTRHGRVIGIRYLELLCGNQCQKYDIEIYELKPFYGTIEKADAQQALMLTKELLSTLASMRMKTDKLTSAAAIYKENVLDKMPIPTILNMPEASLDTHELAYENIHEWIANYKSGNWDRDVYSYDLTAAYPAALADLPNLHWVKKYQKLTEIPPQSYYGIMYGTIHNKTLVSPLINPEVGRSQIGYWKGTINTWEYACCMHWEIAEFQMEYGHFFDLGKYHKLFDYSMRKLYEQRNGSGELQNNLAKAMAVSVIGKFQEERNEKFGELFNPIYADMVTSSVRIKVTDFIYKNKLHNDIASITVDGIKSFKKIDISTQKNFGEWRRVV